MIEPKELKARIAKILELCAAFQSLKYGTPEKKAADKALWDAVNALDRDAGPGCQAGRLLKFGVADGYARYIISKVNSKTVKVVHLDYADGYHSPAVRDGEAFRDEIEDNLAWYDTLNQMRQTAINFDMMGREAEPPINAPAEAVAL